MNIAFLSYFSGINYRGVERYVHELANHMSVRHNVAVYQHGQTSSEKKYETHILDSISALPKFACKPDIVIATNGRLQAASARLWCRINHVKLVIPGQSGPGLDDRLNLFTFPDAFVALTTTQAKWAKNANPFVKVFQIPNGVDLQQFTPTKYHPKNEFLCVAALSPAKRLHLAIQAVAKIPDGKLTIVGSGSEKDSLTRLGKKLLSDRFKILSVPPEQMPSVYQQASVFLFPTSPFESFGIVLLEALASNIPIVATDDPIRREIIGNSGYLVDPTNSKLFSEAIIKAQENNWRNIPRQQAENFSWEKVSQMYENMCTDLLKS